MATCAASPSETLRGRQTASATSPSIRRAGDEVHGPGHGSCRPANARWLKNPVADGAPGR